MGFTLTAAPKKRIKTPHAPRQKTASGDFLQNPNGSRLKKRPQPLRTQQGTTPYSYKIASGRPVWPSRDPIGETGGLNLYVFVGNDGVNQWDVLGEISKSDAVKLLIDACGAALYPTGIGEALAVVEMSGHATKLIQCCKLSCLKGTYGLWVASNKITSAQYKKDIKKLDAIFDMWCK